MCGLKSESTQKRRLSEDKKLTFGKAIEIAQGMESAESKAKEFKSHRNTSRRPRVRKSLVIVVVAATTASRCAGFDRLDATNVVR